MQIGKAIGAHFAAVLVSSLALLVGIETLAHGAIGIVQGVGKWIGGILIFLVISLASLPIGLSIRAMIGQFRVVPIFGALIGGACVGLALLFVLHPAMYPGVSFQTHPVGLTVVHLGAGVIGGWIWHRFEFGAGDKSVA